jgi:uncharacterized membrane protein YdbT with pleckstrin-like domain
MEVQPGEHVLFSGHPSWRSILGFYIKGLLVAILAGVIAGVVTRIYSNHVKVGWVVAAVLVVFVVVLVVGLLRRIAITYTITDQRLTIHTGILSRDMHETRLARVQNVNSSQSLLERMLRVGTVDFDTAAESGYDFRFQGVANPREIVRTVDQAIHQMGSGGPGAEASPAADV